MHRQVRRSAFVLAVVGGSLLTGLPATHLAGNQALAADPAGAERVRQDYLGRLATFRALSEALERESRKTGTDSRETLKMAAGRLDEATRLAAAGEYDIARSVLDDGYPALRTALANLENARAPAARTSKPDDTPVTGSERQAELVQREIASAVALLEALRRQNAERKAGLAAEIAGIESAISSATAVLASGDAARASREVHAAYLRTKSAIAALQPASELKSGSAAEAQRVAAIPDHARADYARRRDSVITLLDTGRRIAAEKGVKRDELAKTESLLKEADALLAGQRFGDGRARLDHAYLLIKETIRSLRGGERLTADKHFASPADEFGYEQARNDDYQALIAGVIAGQSDPSWQQNADKARRLRGEADATARSGDYGSALRKIDESTGYLKSVLRRAGFPIL